jgi:integrase
MAQVIQRTWRAGPRKVKRAAWGYTLMVHGKQERKYDAAWTADDARAALVARQEALRASPPPAMTPPPVMTFAEASARFLERKSRKKTIETDRRYLESFTAFFGPDTPLTAITASRISAWTEQRLAATSPQTGQPYSAAAVNRPLSTLSALLRLARDEWEALPTAPRIRREREPQSRLRWLEPDEEARLLAACQASRNPHLAPIVTVAHETGLRLGELLGLTWHHSIDLSRGVLRLELTKSGKRREVPMRQAVYDVFAAMPEPRQGRVWHQRTVKRGWAGAVQRAGLTDFHFHDLRHSFASWWVMRGGSLQALKDVLGHSSLTMTLKYAHLSPDHLRSEMAKTEKTSDFSTHVSTKAPQSPIATAK